MDPDLRPDPEDPRGPTVGPQAAAALSPSTPSSSTGAMLEGFGKLAAQEQDILGRRSAAMDKAYGDVSAASDKLTKTGDQALATLKSKSKDVGSYQPPDLRDASWQWMSLAATFGTIAGAFSRYHVTTALNAFSGAMQGYAQGNIYRLNEDFKTWKANADAALSNNDKALREYEATMSNAKLNLDQKMSEVQMISSKYQDELMASAAAQKNFTTVAQIMMKKEQLAAQLAQHQETIEYHQKDLQVKLLEVQRKIENVNLNTPAGIERFAVMLENEKDPKKQQIMLNLYTYLHPGGSPQTNPIMPEEVKNNPGGLRSWLAGLYGGGGEQPAGGTASTAAAPGATPAAAAAPAPPPSPETNIGTEPTEKIPLGTAPARPGSAAVPPPINVAPGGRRSLNGKTPETALRLTPGYARAQAAKLPNGTWVINPQTGQPVQIQHKTQPPPDLTAGAQ
jgi:hypothetical protein